MHRSSKAKVEVDQKVKDLNAAIEWERKDHLSQAESVHHRNFKPVEQVKKLKARLKKEKKEKNEIFHTTQNTEEMPDARKQRDETLNKAKKVDELVATAKRRVKDKFEPLIINYNANILKFNDLTWLGKGYLRALALAWEQIGLEEQQYLEGGKVNLTEL